MSRIQKFLSRHHAGCSIHVYSSNRHCSCGQNKAEKEFEKIIGWLKELTDYDIAGSYRYPDIQAWIKELDSDTPPPP